MAKVRANKVLFVTLGLMALFMATATWWINRQEINDYHYRRLVQYQQQYPDLNMIEEAMGDGIVTISEFNDIRAKVLDLVDERDDGGKHKGLLNDLLNPRRVEK